MQHAGAARPSSSNVDRRRKQRNAELGRDANVDRDTLARKRGLAVLEGWWASLESNQAPTDYESAALTKHELEALHPHPCPSVHTRER